MSQVTVMYNSSCPGCTGEMDASDRRPIRLGNLSETQYRLAITSMLCGVILFAIICIALTIRKLASWRVRKKGKASQEGNTLTSQPCSCCVQMSNGRHRTDDIQLAFPPPPCYCVAVDMPKPQSQQTQPCSVYLSVSDNYHTETLATLAHGADNPAVQDIHKEYVCENKEELPSYEEMAVLMEFNNLPATRT